ncbi:hypothetical protein BABINDRAFT_167629 [Babjeviella inositovora NRRL Y-12698]|uniref:INO80 complex subunit B-like conserved region domain-containing protein n=1 Tax=Babjeviella inositovora NRRL Y-12698 TaxID=984486 RepID=A0A1E3QN72_9ASCO|nr:uncharacterized protein BABINDRAFT_167629 [Babjeviella inositovora NRRL Y-12698]ODQ79088.1 hypothetical protein BABINDRAFT_167629 [Babjeviella inositovora NRRL Y-12698]
MPESDLSEVSDSQSVTSSQEEAPKVSRRRAPISDDDDDDEEDDDDDDEGDEAEDIYESEEFEAIEDNDDDIAEEYHHEEEVERKKPVAIKLKYTPKAKAPPKKKRLLDDSEEESDSPPRKAPKSRSARPRAAAAPPKALTKSNPKRQSAQSVTYKDEYSDGEFEDTPNQIDDELLLTDEEIVYDPSTPDISKMTERQRTKYFEEQVAVEAPKEKFLALSNDIIKKVNLTEDEIQLRRAETARRRKNQSEKKLEEEKTETLNKLLKRRAGKVRDLKKLDEQSKDGEDWDPDEGETVKKRPVVKHGALFRWVSNPEGIRLGVPDAAI